MGFIHIALLANALLAYSLLLCNGVYVIDTILDDQKIQDSEEIQDGIDVILSDVEDILGGPGKTLDLFSDELYLANLLENIDLDNVLDSDPELAEAISDLDEEIKDLLPEDIDLQDLINDLNEEVAHLLPDELKEANALDHLDVDVHLLS